MTAIDYTHERSLKELLSGVSHDVALLARQEIQLAKTEISEKISSTAKAAAGIGIGALIAYVGALAIVAGLILALVALGMAAWFAAILIGAALVIVGYGSLEGARKKLTTQPPVPRRTTESIKETVTELKERMS